MIYKDAVILPADILFCKVIEVPPVGHKEMESILMHKLSSFYPGAVEDLKIDFVLYKSTAIVFYISRSNYDAMREESGGRRIVSSFHLLQNESGRNGKYVLSIDGKLDVHIYDDNRLIDLKCFEDTGETRDELLAGNAFFVNESSWTFNSSHSLFTGKGKRNYLRQILISVVLLVAIPQLAYFRQVQLDEEYLDSLKSTVDVMSAANSDASLSEEERNTLLAEYEFLLEKKPVNIYSFLSDLSISLGSDVRIESLILKNNSFRLNGTGINTLGKMERFQNNDLFSAVIPYQVIALDGTDRERFSLTGMYDFE